MTRRLVLSYLAITIVVLAMFEIPLGIFYQQRERDRILVGVERDATVLATIYEDGLERDLELDAGPADKYAADTGGRVVIVDLDGIAALDTGSDTTRDFSTRPEIITALTGARSSGVRTSTTLSTDLVYVAVPVASGGVVHGALRITIDAHEISERVTRFWIGLAISGALVVIVMSGVGWLIARSVTRPVRRLQETATRFSSGDFRPGELDGSAPPELVALETSMNDMALQLDALIKRQREFVADASHQLRTPLTALRLRLENLQSELTVDPAAHEIDAAIAETTRLGTLVEDLLVLARSERREQIAVIDLAATVHDRIDTWTATAELHDVELVLDSDGAAHRVSAVLGGIEQVLDNLLDNAIKVSPPHSTVTVRLAADGSVHGVSVTDQGPGLDDADKQAALTRFWRGDQSTPGTGLGLAIVDSIVRASGGQLTLTDNDPRGLSVTATFPPA